MIVETEEGGVMSTGIKRQREVAKWPGEQR